jgi:hypothetical protein
MEIDFLYRQFRKSNNTTTAGFSVILNILKRQTEEFEKNRRLSTITNNQILEAFRKNNYSSAQPDINGTCVVESGEVDESSEKHFKSIYSDLFLGRLGLTLFYCPLIFYVNIRRWIP